MIRRVLLFAGAILVAACSDGEPIESSTAAAEIPARERLTVVSWNIANLAQEPGAALRGGYVRSAEQYSVLKSRLAELDPDIIAFQEIGSEAALEMVLDTVTYDYAFESRCLNNAESCKNDVGDIYTAIAFRKNLPDAELFQLDELAIDHQDECGESRKVRGAVGVKITLGDKTVWVPSLHMKASCKDDRIEQGTEDDCDTQRAQYEALLTWMNSVPDDHRIILAGDFNRKLLNTGDSIRELFDTSLASSLVFLPDKDVRACWSRDEVSYNFNDLKAEARKNNPEIAIQNVDPRIYTSDSNQEIDFLILSGDFDEYSVSSDQIEMTGQYSFSNPGSTITACDGRTIVKFENSDRALVFGESMPSDHCPVIVTLEPK